MNSSEFVSDYDDDISVVIVSLNITETNRTLNGSMPKAFRTRPDEDKSINTIIFGIGLAVVILLLILIIIKIIHKCYKWWREAGELDADKLNDPNKKSLLPSPSSSVVRRNSSIRSQTAPSQRSSLNIETQMEIRNKRSSQQFNDNTSFINNNV